MNASRRIRMLVVPLVLGLALLPIGYLEASRDHALAAQQPVPPDNCTVAPRPVADFVLPSDPSLGWRIGRIVSNEAELPPGLPADAATIAEIEALEWQLAACLNAGDLRRAAALYTDAALRDVLALRVPSHPIDEDFPVVGSLLGLVLGDDEVERAAERLADEIATPMRRPADERVAVAVRDVRLFPDGRAGAIVERDSAASAATASLHGYERVDGRWLLDGVVVVASPQPDDAAVPESL